MDHATAEMAEKHAIAPGSSSAATPKLGGAWPTL